MATHTQQWILRAFALACFAVLATHQFFAFSLIYERLRWPENQPDSGFSVGAPWPTVTHVAREPAAAGLRPGDRLIAVQGQPYTGETARASLFEKLFPGDRVTVTVVPPGGAPHDIAWPLAAIASTEDLLGRILILIVLALALPVLCLGLGFWTVFVRPLDRQAWLLLGMLVTFAHTIVQPAYFKASLGALGHFLQDCHWMLTASWGLCMFLFAWYFPQQTPWQRANRNLLRLLTATLSIAAALGALRHIALDHGWAPLVNGLQPYAVIVEVLQMAAISGFFALLTYKRLTLSSTEAVRRLRIILLGALWSLTPVFLLVIISYLFRRPLGSFPEWLLLPALLAMGLFPVTLAYVIIVHRAFAIGVVIRQGLRYALAQRAVRILQMLLSIGILLAAVLLASQPGLNRARIIQTAAFGAALVLLLQRVGEKL
ncbi:MAG TPA: hypothetical protein VFQ91_21420, partial [Bryobacteraceae bacterium]|nr:hypothetical protein [Bryobacteraceae bacterium]